MSEPANLEIELELTYLAREIPAEIKNIESVEMLDIYVPADAEHPSLRLRKKGENYEITKKKPIDEADVSTQTEQTIPLEPAEFNALAGASQRSIQKNRYKAEIGGHMAEVDIFSGDLKGLVLIDFEFDSPEERAAFQPPDCCLADVTQEHFVAGGLLSGKSYEDITPDLQRFNYKALTL